MAGDFEPLDQKFAITNPADGTPTDYFIRWAQQKQIDIGEAITLPVLEEFLAEHVLQEGIGIQITPDGNLANNPTISADIQELLDQLSSTRGAVIYRGLLGWTVLVPGTAGYVLQTGGAGADPSWVAQSGGGGGDFLDQLNEGTSIAVMPIYGNNAVTTIGALVTSSGTSGANWANTNEFTKRKRTVLLCAAAINSVRTLYVPEAMPCGIGDGWRWRGRVGITADVATSKFMFGFTSNTALGAGIEPSAVTAAVLCVGKDTTDNNLQILHNDAAGGACTKIDLGASFPARTNNADIYDVEFNSPLGATVINYRVTNIVSGAVATGTINANCPAAGTGVTDQGLKIGNATTALSYQVSFFGMTYKQQYAADIIP